MEVESDIKEVNKDELKLGSIEEEEVDEMKKYVVLWNSFIIFRWVPMFLKFRT